MTSSTTRKIVHVCDIFKRFDTFGESVSFTVKDGKTKYNTYLGAFVSLCVYFVLIIYAYKKLTFLVSYQDAQISRYTRVGINKDTEFTFEQMEMEIGLQIAHRITKEETLASRDTLSFQVRVI